MMQLTPPRTRGTLNDIRKNKLITQFVTHRAIHVI